MADVMMSLGDFRFGLDTAAYDRLSLEAEYRWPVQDRLTVMPAAQFVGPGAEKVSLQGTIYPHFRGGLGQVDSMREQAARGEPLLLTDGQGRVWGDFVILRVSETHGTLFANGAPRKIDFALELLRYADDREEASPVRVGGEAAASAWTPGAPQRPSSGLPRANEVNPATGQPFSQAELAGIVAEREGRR